MAGIDSYNQKVLEHFFAPRNIGKIENPDGVATVGDPRCGDFIKVWVSVKDQTISDFKYKVFGCGAAIATTSVVSELTIGKTLEEALELSDDDVIAYLGGLPEGKQHCSLLGIRGLQMAIADFTVKENHKHYVERIEQHRRFGYDIPSSRARLADRLSDLPAEARILDLGCGKGHLSIAIAQTGRKCTAVDCSPEELRFALLNALYFEVNEKVDFQQQDARELTFNTDTFDAVLSAELIHHVEAVEPVLSEMLRVCVGGGRLIVADLNDKGQNALSRSLGSEDRQHRITGWPMGRVGDWFKARKCDVQVEDEDCQTILIVNKR